MDEAYVIFTSFVKPWYVSSIRAVDNNVHIHLNHLFIDIPKEDAKELAEGIMEALAKEEVEV